ncbi:carbonic anhydrase [Scenedesmus sp. NREL 46B-D3]|nr:carbonic anhydrase [Scenedesmus sp. NREL 46B-D3]
MTLGAKKKLSIATCMDSRLLIDKMLPGVDIGDVEIIRNAGGRVTMDVVRSLFVAQEVPELSTRAVLLLHHTDCGAMAAIRHHDQLALASAWGLLLPRFVRKKVLNAVMRPFADPAGSVKEDVWLLRNAPLMPKDIPIYGMVYDVQTGRMHHVLTSPAGKA